MSGVGGGGRRNRSCARGQPMDDGTPLAPVGNGRPRAAGRLLGRRAAKGRQLGRWAAKGLLLGRRAAHGVRRHDAVSRLSGWWILRRERGKRGEGTS